MVGAGGLFGDLPAAKNDGTDGNTKTSANTATEGDAGKTTSGKDATTTTSTNEKESNSTTTTKTTAATPAFLQPTRAIKKNKAAATTMAFLPAALRKRATAPPLPPFSKSNALPATATKVITTAASSNATTTAGETKTCTINPVIESSKGLMEKPATTTTTVEQTIEDNNKVPRFSVDYTAVSTTIRETQSTFTPSENTVPSESFMPTEPHMIKEEDQYDPAYPNDLLQYWEKAVAARERVRLERQAAEQQKTQEALRAAAAAEKERLLAAADYQGLAQHLEKQQVVTTPLPFGRSTAPRGRGRGVSNLPAWMVERNRQNQSKNTDGP